MVQPIRVLIADDNVRTRDGLRALLVTYAEIEVVGEATNGQEVVRLVDDVRPDVVLMDLQMSVMDGVQAAQLIKNRWPEVTVIILTMLRHPADGSSRSRCRRLCHQRGAPERLLSALGMDRAMGER